MMQDRILCKPKIHKNYILNDKKWKSDSWIQWHPYAAYIEMTLVLYDRYDTNGNIIKDLFDIHAGSACSGGVYPDPGLQKSEVGYIISFYNKKNKIERI